MSRSRGRPKGSGYHLDDAVKAIYFAAAGQATRAMEDCIWLKCHDPEFSDLVVPPSLRTLQVACKRDISTAERALVLGGPKELREHLVFPAWEAPYRTHTCVTDVLHVPSRIKRPGTQKELAEAWAIFVIDDKHRLVLGHHIEYHPPNGDSVIAALARAVMPDFRPRDGMPGCGIPENLRMDNETIFATNRLADVCQALGINPSYCDFFKANQKGKVERFHRTMNQGSLAGEAGWDRGPRGIDGKHINHWPTMMSPEELELKIDGFVRRYNQTPHRSLGCTPVESWTSDPTPLRVVSTENLPFLLHQGGKRIMQKSGIEFKKGYYYCADAMLSGGDPFEVWWVPGNLRRIWLYDANGLVGTADRREYMTDGELAEMRARRGVEQRHLAAEVEEFRTLMHRVHTGLRVRDNPAAKTGSRHAARVPMPGRPSRRARRLAVLD